MIQQWHCRCCVWPACLISIAFADTQLVALLLPLCCCSASNYLLGLTPVQRGPMLLGTVAGMSIWSILYASLGGASRALLDGGADLEALLEGAALLLQNDSALIQLGTPFACMLFC
eukprot:GHRQ01029162.1.p3 GENE.GHRQ01029162.1~~GHRQ01029162.1.p3  ORF type:complete len:116 (+),score=35.18 GHRQ01029162.1:173-520(+)